MGGRTLIMFGVDVVARLQIDTIALDFPIFLVGNAMLKVSNFLRSQAGENCSRHGHDQFDQFAEHVYIASYGKFSQKIGPGTSKNLWPEKR